MNIARWYDILTPEEWRILRLEAEYQRREGRTNVNQWSPRLTGYIFGLNWHVARPRFNLQTLYIKAMQYEQLS